MKYKLLIDDRIICHGFFEPKYENVLHEQQAFIKARVKDDVKVELIIWSENR
jgi:hypothetical protein